MYLAWKLRVLNTDCIKKKDIVYIPRIPCPLYLMHLCHWTIRENRTMQVSLKIKVTYILHISWEILFSSDAFFVSHANLLCICFVFILQSSHLLGFLSVFNLHYFPCTTYSKFDLIYKYFACKATPGYVINPWVLYCHILSILPRN